jgi:hypothetical protein
VLAEWILDITIKIGSTYQSYIETDLNIKPDKTHLKIWKIIWKSYESISQNWIILLNWLNTTNEVIEVEPLL